jgi:hypothetical protein|tara:strand:- start:518 stop:1195 length:678 start_codon:yes stop_codon:yes gene_type:complete
MIYPTIIIDNFFTDPDEVRKIGLELPKPDNYNLYPGVRTKPLHESRLDFFNWSTNKIAAAMFQHQPHDQKIEFNAYQSFQAIKPNPNEGMGWIHNDNDYEFTAIVYMSKHKNCGTSFYRREQGFFPFQDPNHVNNNTIKQEYYGSDKKYDARYKKARDGNNRGYEKTLQVDSIYNRLLIFDSYQYHGVENFYDPENKEDRLTLITFFKDIKGYNRAPVPNVRRFF